MNPLLIVFTIFAVIDLTLVGITSICVMILVRKVMLGKVEKHVQLILIQAKPVQ